MAEPTEPKDYRVTFAFDSERGKRVCKVYRGLVADEDYLIDEQETGGTEYGMEVIEVTATGGEKTNGKVN